MDRCLSFHELVVGEAFVQGAHNHVSLQGVLHDRYTGLLDAGLQAWLPHEKDPCIRTLGAESPYDCVCRIHHLAVGYGQSNGTQLLGDFTSEDGGIVGEKEPFEALVS